MSTVYIPLKESIKQDVHPIFFYPGDDGELHGSLCHATTKINAGDRKIHICAHDMYHGHILPVNKKAIKEGNEMKTYAELLDYINEAKDNSPLVFHFPTRTDGNGGGPIYQKGSLSREKAEKMADGRPLQTTPLASYKGHLTSAQM